jgi:lysophospholipase L1-like esterase/predicted esterase
MKKFISIISFLLVSAVAFAQVNVVFMGSSTTAGTGPSSSDSAFVNRLQAAWRKNMSDGKDTVCINLGVGGSVSYNGLPTGTSIPGKPSPDINHNITKAISYEPAMIFVNYPTNDFDDTHQYTDKEWMDNMRTIFQVGKAAGARVFIASPQPRNWYSDPVRLMMKHLLDSVNTNFGKYGVDFWTDNATVDNKIISANDAGDGIHLNNQGHRFLFQRVIAKDLFQPAFITDYYKTGPNSFDKRPARTSLPNDYFDSLGTAYSLVIFLHGTGAASNTLDTAKLEMEALPYWIAHGQMPQVVTNGSAQKFIVFCPQHDWFSVGQDSAQIRLMLDDIVQRYRVDVSRIYITGLSAGGQGAQSAISSNPALTKRFAAAYLVSVTGYNHTYERDSLPSAGKLWGVRMWAVVGSHDDFSHGCACTDGLNRTTDAVNQFNLLNPAVPAIETIIPNGVHDANTVFNPVYDKGWANNSANPSHKNVYQWFSQYQSAAEMIRFPLKVSDAYQTNNVSRDIADLIDDDHNTRFFPTYPTYGVILQPHNVVIDMADYFPAVVKRLVWYDGAGSGYDCRIVFVRSSDGHEDTVATFTGDLFNSSVTIDIPAQYQYIVSKVILRSPSGGDGYPQDLQLWGTFTQHTDPVFSRFNQPLKYFRGANCGPWDYDTVRYPVKYKAVVDLRLHSLRVYSDAYADKDIDGNYRFNPESRGFEQERSLAGLQKDIPGFEGHICYQNQALDITPSWQAAGKTSFLNIPYGPDRNLPSTYTNMGRDLFILTERGGRNANLPDYPIYHGPFYEEPQQMLKGAGFYKIVEGGNEWNAWWGGIDTYLGGSQLAAGWSMMYDGHKGSVANAGVKTADSTMIFSPGGIASDKTDIYREAYDWWKSHRGLKPNGNVDAALDEQNFHIYPSEGGQYGNSHGALPFEIEGIDKVKEQVYVAKKYGGMKPAVITEWGFDLHPNGPLSAPAYGPYTAEQTRGNWAMRAIFLFAEADLYRAEWYRLYQDWWGSTSESDTTGYQIADSNAGQFSQMALLRVRNGAATSVYRTLVGDYFKQLSEFDDYRYDSTYRADSIYHIRFKNPSTGKRMHTIWKVEKALRVENQRPQFTERTQVYAANISGTIRRFVNDSSGVMSSEPATNTITIGAKPLIVQEGTAAPNHAPSSNAGSDISIQLPQNTVTLAGSGSDPDGTIASVQWTQVSGASTVIVSPTNNSTVITGLAQGVYVFRFTVTDNGGASASDTVQVTVLAPSYTRTFSDHVRYIFKTVGQLLRPKRKTSLP